MQSVDTILGDLVHVRVAAVSSLDHGLHVVVWRRIKEAECFSLSVVVEKGASRIRDGLQTEEVLVGRARTVQRRQRQLEIGETVHKLCEVVGGDRHRWICPKNAAIVLKKPFQPISITPKQPRVWLQISPSQATVSYTHLTLPTNREV